MTFYLESEQLDLAKKYTNFEYEPLVNELAPKVQLTTVLELKPTTESEGVNQNEYTLLQEKDLILFDLANLIQYVKKYKLDPKYFNPQTLVSTSDEESTKVAAKFPFHSIKNRLCYMFQKYQEQPVLLEPILEPVVQSIMEIVDSYLTTILQSRLKEFKVLMEIHELVNIVYVLCKVRGYKYITKLFPHEVRCLEPVLYYLVKQRNNEAHIWETKYVFIHWLSIIILVPFDLSTIDSSLTNLVEVGAKKTIYDNLINIMKFYLNSSSKTRDAAATFLSHFFSRPDIQKSTQLVDYIKWACDTIKELQSDPFHSFYVTGIFHSLVELFKIGQRGDVIGLIPTVYSLLVDETKGEKKKVVESSILRLLKCKLAQRIALQYLRPRMNKWAYKRSSNSLRENFKKTSSTTKLQTNVVSKVTQDVKTHTFEVQTSTVVHADQPKKHNIDTADIDDEEYFADVDFENLEGIIDLLVQSLRDKDTIVRWSAAKGIGRITQRLDQDLADEIVNTMTTLFSAHETDCSWHGGCLAIGELSRRGLLLPERLKDIFPILFKALQFDQNQGNYSIGAHVRDSACYVAWAFARAYDPAIIKEYMLKLAQNLLIVSVFDREVNCRRAAAAAFQEHVGRQGTFPHGIDILTEADYFTLGVRSNAYLKVAPFVGHYEEYLYEFIENLSDVKLKNWDPELRKLSAASLSLLSPLAPEYVAKKILPKLIELCLNESVLVRHGAIYGVSEILLGLAGRSDSHCCVNLMKDSIFLKSLSKNERKLIKAGEYMTLFRDQYEETRKVNNLKYIEQDTIQNMLEVVQKIEKARLYRGKGGEIMRNGVCRLIEVISMAQIPLSEDKLKVYMMTLDECIQKPQEELQENAETALRAFSRNYHTENLKEFVKFFDNFLARASSDPNVAITRGYTRSLSCLSLAVLRVNKDKVFKVLEENCRIKEKDLDDADTRKHAINSYQEILASFIEEQDNSVDSQAIENFFKVASNLMSDYTTDKRGDIGSMVREASMYSMANILKLLAKKSKISPDYNVKISAETVARSICLMLQQLVEKIDRTRLIAGSILQDLADNSLGDLPAFTGVDKIRAIFNKENIQKLLQAEQNRLDSNFSLSEEMKGKNFAQISTQENTFGDINLENMEGFVYYWNLPHCVFPAIIPLLKAPEFSYYILKGLIISVGGLTESINKHSYNALMDYVEKISQESNYEELLKRLFNEAIQLLKEHPNDERVIIPLFKTLERLFEREEVLSQKDVLKDQIIQISELILKEITGTKSVNKLNTGVSTLLNILRFEIKEVSYKIISVGPTILLKPYPIVRKTFIDKLYFYLMMNGEETLGEELNDQVTILLTEHQWFEMPIPELKQMKEPVNKVFEEFKKVFAPSNDGEL